MSAWPAAAVNASPITAGAPNSEGATRSKGETMYEPATISTTASQM